ncbi:MAG: hypothetical protein ACLQPD_18845 [Desulfomonilaceae bacterium]
MNGSIPIHPVEILSSQDKCDIYFSRIVDLAVASDLLDPDTKSEIGHFAFSTHYTRGKDLDHRFQTALREFEEKHPDLVLERRELQSETSVGAADEFFSLSNDDKVRELKIVGASRRVWPTGTSFVLTYPWDDAGNGKPVGFRTDLSDFMKRRVLRILNKAGKLRNSNLFV